jgi:hypothetical protein
MGNPIKLQQFRFSSTSAGAHTYTDDVVMLMMMMMLWVLYTDVSLFSP